MTLKLTMRANFSNNKIDADGSIDNRDLNQRISTENTVGRSAVENRKK